MGPARQHAAEAGWQRRPDGDGSTRQTGGGNAERHPQRAGPAAPRARSPGVRLTAFGALLSVFVSTFLGGLLDGVFTPGYGALTAVGFVLGCVTAAARARTGALLVLTVSPPLVFVAGVTAAETVRSWGSGHWFRDAGIAVTTALAGNAFWAVAGTAATALIALARGYAARRAVHTRSARQSTGRANPPRPAR